MSRVPSTYLVDRWRTPDYVTVVGMMHDARRKYQTLLFTPVPISNALVDGADWGPAARGRGGTGLAR